MTTLLAVEGVWAGYGRAPVLRGLSLEVSAGTTVAFIGPNGAGKTTLLRTIAGTIRPSQGAILFDGVPIQEKPSHDVVKKGIAHVPQGRHLFSDLTVEENLRAGGYTVASKAELERRIDALAEFFPIIRDRRRETAWKLSGGQQQMVAIARGLMIEPRLMLLDEPSLGLAPAIIDIVAELVATIKTQGKTVLLSEQNVPLALALADVVYLVAQGTVVAQGTPDELRDHPEIRRAYLGRSASSVS